MVTNSLEETDRGQFLCGGYFKEHLVGQDKTTDRCVVALALHNSQLERVKRAKTTAKPVASYQFFGKQVTDRTILTYSWFEGDHPVCHLFLSHNGKFYCLFVRACDKYDHRHSGFFNLPEPRLGPFEGRSYTFSRLGGFVLPPIFDL
jgi:hypothetical protein